jgi:hypothetical protein
MTTTSKALLTGLAIAAMGFAGAPSVEASAIQLTSGSSTVTIYDNLAGDLDPAVGQIFHAGTLGAFTLDIEFATTKPTVPSTATSPQMTLNFAVTTGATGGTLVIDFSDDFWGPTGPLAFATASGASTGNVTYATLQDPANNLFTGSLITAASTGPGSIAFADIGPLVTTSFPYSLTQRWIIGLGPNGVVGANSILFVTPFVAPVPDGGWAVGLLGFALMGVEGLRRKFTRV